MGELEKLFNRFKEAQNNIQFLSSIVQNEGMTVTDEEIYTWRSKFHAHMMSMQRLESDVLRYYGK